MKKIYRLREWLTTEEAAKHLSTVLGEEVAVSDILRLALDGHLTLSVNFVNKARARLGRVVPHKDVTVYSMPSLRPGAEPGEVMHIPAGMLLDEVDEVTDETRYLCFDDKVVSIDGIWDLPMIGCERIEIEDAFQELTSGPAVELINLEGAFACRADGQWAQLQDRFEKHEISTEFSKKWTEQSGYYPAPRLPPDSHLVVRMEALTDFQAQLLSPSPRTSSNTADLGTRERDTLLKMVVGMALEAYRYEPSAARSPIPAEISGDLAKHGLSVTDDTVRKYLKEAAATLLPSRA